MTEFFSHPCLKENTVEKRLYQEVLAARVLERGNSLVVAPTALGKTIISALLAAELLQKSPKKKILIMAPTKPLAVQHQKTLKRFLAIPEEKISLVTGTTPPDDRAKIWENSSIVSATPQTIENDIVTGRISLENVSLAVFDECHRAVGDYSYVFIGSQFAKKCPTAIILGLTASPGSEEEKIQEVCSNLSIKNIEIKSHSDEDVKAYTHKIDVEWRRVQLPEEFLEIQGLLNGFQDEQVQFLRKIGYVGRKSFLRKTELLELQARIRRDIARKGNEMPYLFQAASKAAAIFKVSHAQILLETQGIPSLKKYFDKIFADAGQSGSSKAAKYVAGHKSIVRAMAIAEALDAKGVIHPKLGELKKILFEQFSKSPDSRVIVFNQYRDNVKMLEGEINREGIAKARQFIGQADKESGKGMSQKEQVQAIKEFEAGTFNVMVASSVAEEGLDIPSVDLVVFYETVPSEIRHIQRRGRTGRLSEGKAIILMAKGTRDEAYYYSSMAKERRMKSTLHTMQQIEAIALPQQPKTGKMDSQTTLGSFAETKGEKIRIFVDQREQASNVSKELVEMGCVITMKQLEVGDFLITNDICVERKTIEDFISSLLDGRLFIQLQNMAENFSQPLMLVEGNKDELFTIRNVHRNAIIGTMTSIALNYRIPILFTNDEHETAEFIFVTAKREQLGKGHDIRLRIGRKGLTLPEQQRFLVESLPGIGPNTARLLLRHFGSIRQIANASEKELQQAENIGEKKAKAIRKVLDANFEER